MLVTVQEKNGGMGVFASDTIKTGGVVIEKSTKSKQITQDEVEQLSDEFKHYVGVFEDKFFLLAEPNRYLNHSCNPNTKWLDGCKYATRDILKGEEVTIDYEIGGKPLLRFECNCGETNCRRYIKGYF